MILTLSFELFSKVQGDFGWGLGGSSEAAHETTHKDTDNFLSR
jgi:hypothetical protein